MQPSPTPSRAKTFCVPLAVGATSERSAARGGGGRDPRSAGAPTSAELERVVREARRAVEAVKRPAAALYFYAGPPSWARPLAEALASPDLPPSLLVPTAGVLTDEGDLDAAPALAGVVWTGGSAVAAAGDEPETLAQGLATGGTLLVFAAAEGFDAQSLGPLASRHARCFGAGVPTSELFALRNGEVTPGRLAALRLGQAPLVEQASSCKLVSEPLVITEMQGELVTRLDGLPALDVLREKVGGGKHGGGLVLVAVLENGHADRFLVRPLRGIDTDRRGLVVAAQLREGDTIAVAVRDGLRAREVLTETARRLEREARGAAPTFALYVSCAGRGRSLYNAPDVDLRILKQRFAGVPIAGMHAAFELVPWGEGAVRLQLMSGVLALFSAPS